jgi:hypothetical protein
VLAVGYGTVSGGQSASIGLDSRERGGDWRAYRIDGAGTVSAGSQVTGFGTTPDPGNLAIASAADAR